MPNEFETLAKYAAEHGYLRLTERGVALDTSRNDPLARRLKDLLSVREGGNIDETVLVRPDPSVTVVEEFQRRATQARLATARAAMERGWKNLGGSKSVIGLPLHDQIIIKEVGSMGRDGYTAEFRGGTLHLLQNKVVTDEQTLVNINLVGLECQIRQEATDEMYGVVSVLGPANSTIVSRRFPESETINMGPDGMRINQLNVELVRRGVLQDYIIWAALVENDSGDVDVIARNITDKFAEVAAAAVGALTGAPAEGVADSESFKENMVTGLAWVFGNVLGMGDDPYNAESFRVSWTDLKVGTPPIKPEVRRNDDPRTIKDWTHSLILSGIDDGGDRGQYALYFKVWTEQQKITSEASTSP